MNKGTCIGLHPCNSWPEVQVFFLFFLVYNDTHNGNTEKRGHVQQQFNSSDQ